MLARIRREHGQLHVAFVIDTGPDFLFSSRTYSLHELTCIPFPVAFFGSVSCTTLGCGISDAAFLSTNASITDSITFQNTDAVALTAKALTFLGNQIIISQCAMLSVVSFPKLTFVGTSVSIAICNGLTLVDFAKLEVAPPSIGFVLNPLMAFLLLPLLAQAGDELDITHDAALTVISLPQLTFLSGELLVTNKPTLTLLFLPKLTFMGYIL